VHYFDPHAPYGDTDPDGLVRGLGELQKAVFNSTDIKIARARIVQARRLYEKDVRALDVQLARLFERLRADEDEYETHVVLVADHGESFGEDDSLGHGRRLTEAQLRVPLVVHSPRVEPGRRDVPVSSVDVAATLVSLAGANVRMPHGRDLTSESLGRELVAGMRTTFRGVERDGRVTGGHQTLRGERWFLYEPWGLVSGDSDSAYLDDDEARPAPEDVARRSTQLFAIFADELVGAVEIDDEETRSALEALGYAE
jgi:arylsulfatase A-like enzyme